MQGKVQAGTGARVASGVRLIAGAVRLIAGAVRLTGVKAVRLTARRGEARRPCIQKTTGEAVKTAVRIVHTEKTNAGKKEVEIKVNGRVQKADVPPGAGPRGTGVLEDLANFGRFLSESGLRGLVIMFVAAAWQTVP